MTHTWCTLALTPRIPRALFILLKRSPSVLISSAFPPSFSPLVIFRAILLIEVPPLRRRILLFLFQQHVVPSHCYNVLPRRPYVALYSPFVPPSPFLPPRQYRSPFLTLAVRMQSRVFIARERLISSRCPLLGILAGTREFQPRRVRRRKCALHPRRSRHAACSLFRLLSRSDRPSPSVIKRIRRPSLFSRRRRSRALRRSPFYHEHAVDSLALPLRLSPSIRDLLSLSCNCRFFFFPVRNTRYHPLFHHERVYICIYINSFSLRFCLYFYLCFYRLLSAKYREMEKHNYRRDSVDDCSATAGDSLPHVFTRVCTLARTHARTHADAIQI